MLARVPRWLVLVAARGHRGMGVEPRDRGVEVMVEVVEARAKVRIGIEARVEALRQVRRKIGAIVQHRRDRVADLRARSGRACLAPPG